MYHEREQFSEAGADTYAGRARFAGENRLAVEPDHADPAEEPTLLEAETIVLACGSQPAPLGCEGEELLTLSNEFLELPDVPARVLLVGGGYISCEFAHALLRAGRTVTILESSPHILDPFDSHLADRLADRTRELGATILTGVKLTKLERNSDGSLTATAEGEDGEEHAILCDLAIHGSGRVPSVDRLDCEAGHVACGKGGIAVDAHLRSTSNPRVFACGDVADTGHPMLTPVAEAHGEAVVRAILTGEGTEPDLKPLPSTTFTEPELAAVGPTAVECNEAGTPYELVEADLGTKGAFRKRCERTAGYRILLNPDDGTILAAHLLGPDAGELINSFALAKRFGITLKQLADSPLTYPSLLAEIVQDAAKRADADGTTGAEKAALS